MVNVHKRGYWSKHSNNLLIKCYSISLNYIFDRIRYYVLERKDYDVNVDYVCVFCSHPVLRRYLYCNIECSDTDDLYHEGK